MYDSDNSNNNNERSAGDIIFGFKRKYDNFWYYYKWHALIAIAIVIFIIVCVTQCVSQYAKKTQSDANIAYIGAKEIRGGIFSALQEDFNFILNENSDSDEKLSVDFINFFYMTSVEIENARAVGGIVDIQALMTVKKQIDIEILNGSSVIYFLSPGVYRELAQAEGIFMPLDDALGYTPDSAMNNYCIKLSELYCREYFEGLYNLPEDTLIAVRNYQTVSKRDDKETARYERNFNMLKKLIEFAPLQDELDDMNDLEEIGEEE